jgi:hypothetical protein
VRLAPGILARLFDEMDHNKDGRVEFDEFVEYMVTHGFTSRAATDGPAQIVDSVFDILDADRSGTTSNSASPPYLPHISRASRLHLAHLSPASAPYLRCICPQERHDLGGRAAHHDGELWGGC